MKAKSNMGGKWCSLLPAPHGTHLNRLSEEALAGRRADENNEIAFRAADSCRRMGGGGGGYVSNSLSRSGQIPRGDERL